MAEPAYVGVHLDPGGAGPSAVAVLGADARLTRLELAGDDDGVLAALPPASRALLIDAPLVIPNTTGKRDLEAVMAWCDVGLFPVSARRMVRAFGGARGVGLAPRLAGGAARPAEAAPALILRELAWERAHPPERPALALADYRRLWLATRGPLSAVGPRGRADGAAQRTAAELLAGVVDLDGWLPAGGGRSAAGLDAIACAYAALRADDPGRGPTLRIGTPERGELVTPADRNLIARARLHLDRLRAAGEIAI